MLIVFLPPADALLLLEVDWKMKAFDMEMAESPQTKSPLSR
jgi:hypothetical protein